MIGGEPKLRDPGARAACRRPTRCCSSNVAQGLVRFDAGGNIVAGLAERWNVSDDGLSYIFRLASTDWPDGKQDHRAAGRASCSSASSPPRSRNPLKDSLGAIDDVVAMTDRVIEIQLVAPRPNLLSLLAQPELAMLRGSAWHRAVQRRRAEQEPGGELRLTREIIAGADDEAAQREEVLLAGAAAAEAIGAFAAGKADLVLGGTFADLPLAQRAQAATRMRCGSIRPPACSGWFPLAPAARSTSPRSATCWRRRSTAAISIDALGVPGLAAARDLARAGPRRHARAGRRRPGSATPLARPPRRRFARSADRLFGKTTSRRSGSRCPTGPAPTCCSQELARDWGALGLTVERAAARQPPISR